MLRKGEFPVAQKELDFVGGYTRITEFRKSLRLRGEQVRFSLARLARFDKALKKRRDGK